MKKKYLAKSTKGSRLFSFMIIQSTVACSKSHREPTVKKQREINATGQHQGIGCGNFREDQKWPNRRKVLSSVLSTPHGRQRWGMCCTPSTGRYSEVDTDQPTSSTQWALGNIVKVSESKMGDPWEMTFVVVLWLPHLPCVHEHTQRNKTKKESYNSQPVGSSLPLFDFSSLSPTSRVTKCVASESNKQSVKHFPTLQCHLESQRLSLPG